MQQTSKRSKQKWQGFFIISFIKRYFDGCWIVVFRYEHPKAWFLLAAQAQAQAQTAMTQA